MFVVDVLVHDPTVVSESGEVAEYVTAVFALVNLVSPVSLNVCPEVVPASVATPADVTGKRLLAGVDAHVTSEVGGANELSPAHHAGVRSLRLRKVPVYGSTSILPDVWRSYRVDVIDHDDGRLHQGEPSSDLVERVHRHLSV